MVRFALTETFVDAMAALGPGDAKQTVLFLQKLTRAEDISALRPEHIHDAMDRAIRSLRVTRDLRTVAHVNNDQWLLLFVGQHDAAYVWARDHCVACHPVTGELQVVADPIGADARLATWVQPPVPGIFDAVTDTYLLSIGTPPEWIPTIRQIRSEEMFLAVAADMPAGVADRLMRVATGEIVAPPEPARTRNIMDAEPSHEWICTISDTESLCELLDSRGIPHDPLH